jgi:hypothetical protein
LKTGIHSIIQKIQTDAELHSGERYEQIKIDIDRLIESDNEFYTDDYNKRREVLRKHNEIEYSRLIERLHSRLNREILTYQHYLIDEIFNMAVSKLITISESEFSRIFISAVRGLKGKFTVHIGEFSKGKLNKETIRKAEMENEGLSIVLSDSVVPLKSGFILRDDRIENNCLFEDLIADIKNEQMATVLKEVFES